MNENVHPLKSKVQPPDFFKYWEALGFFDNIQMSLPQEFFILFEIARLIATQETDSSAQSAIRELLKQDSLQSYDRNKSISLNRLEKNSPLSEKMEIENYKTIYDLKKALPRELMWDKLTFNIKLFTKTLLVRKFFEIETDKFKAISPIKDDKGRNRTGFEQKFYLLFDRSRSMEKRMRSFYSKTIVVEFLRRKLDSKAKLFFRAFDSKPGSLVKVEKNEDFPSLIEKVIFTATGGTSTNMQKAILQAIEDMRYDKEIMDAEILVVTDGLVHDLDVPAMKEKLKDIKLNFLKIGLDLAEPNGYEVKHILSEAGYNFDPFSINIKDIKKKLESSEEVSSLSRQEQKIYEYMLKCSEDIMKDMKSISHRFIEIDDIQPSDFTIINEDVFELIKDAIEKLLQVDMDKTTTSELGLIYKKAFFLSQYIEFLLKSENIKNKPMLQKAAKELSLKKQKMLNNPHLLKMISETNGFEEDKKSIKSSKKAARSKLKKMKQLDRTLTRDEMKSAQIILSISPGSGSGPKGGLLFLLLIKLWEIIKAIIKKIRF